MPLNSKLSNAITEAKDFLFPAEKILATLDAYTASTKNELKSHLQQASIPVLTSAAELEAFAAQYWDYFIVPYFLYKETAEELLLSTSSMHMNWLWPNVLYVPMNVSGQDHTEKRKIYECAFKWENIIFYNHTIPHKSHPVMQAMFGPGNGDYLIRQENNTFLIADGNGKAFIQMVKKLGGENADFTQAIIVIVGVGGSGTLAAKAIVAEHPKRLILVDIADKNILASELGAEFYHGIANVPDLTGEQLFIIDSTAHFEDGIQRSIALDLVEKYDAPHNVFIDYNMNTPIGAYGTLATKSGVGKEYVAFTNYIMALEITKAAAALGVTLAPITQATFDQAVSQSVIIRDRIKAALLA